MRLRSIDALRGIVMIVMALDHVREFFHAGAMSFQPEDLTRTNAALFLTRWITHFCAPVFMFTAGLGAFFHARRSTGRLSTFLWTRGMWLVLLEITVLRFIMNFGVRDGVVLLSILWALGWSMVALGFLTRLPVRALAIVSIATIALHNLADPVRASRFGGAAWVWNILHQPGIFRMGSILVLAAYPLVPWIAVMAAGFCFGEVMVLDSAARAGWMFRIGAGVTLAFVVVRGINLYGDPQPWSTRIPGMTVLSFLRCAKYPPSLDFLLMTLGPAILLLAWLERFTFAKTNPVMVFGRVPLFYFLGHLFLARLLTIPFALMRYGSAAFLFGPLPSMGGSLTQFPVDYGYHLGVVYLIWVLAVALMYPACLWFAGLKERRSDWWLRYL